MPLIIVLLTTCLLDLYKPQCLLLKLLLCYLY